MSKSGISVTAPQTTLLEPRVSPIKPKSKRQNSFMMWLRSIPLFMPHLGTHCLPS